MQRRHTTIATTGTVAVLAAALLGASPGAPASAAKADGQLYLVQAVPGIEVDVEVDGRPVEQDVATGDVVGPWELPAGAQELTLSNDDWSTDVGVRLTSGAATDVVLHLPAARGGDPVASTYAVPDAPIGPGKARVVLAHTATAPPADVRVDGRTVFTNIANGEYAEADVPSGGHAVALLPSGSDRGAFLGPIDVDLPAETVTMVYAVGSPQDNSMRAVAHSAALASDGSVAPTRIETGSSAGLARDLLTAVLGPR
ncbi:DUF4397 domain-containing protein [Nocardioides sp. AX2bis]|uniref:DUF4397 domain-containing protein n=1 Tax=Nocardioides sp. AX2bis TaxID=2653157 RepID=UPI0012F3EC9F|nr:DUF4397 domain-containing protein [Nocardioides sp. AX2bis]VXB47775.1 conserved exported hypothetical protein [Nocardioides sp. AX2bis]